MEKAGFWKLCAAYLIDFVFISIAGLILGAILGGIIGALLALLGKPETGYFASAPTGNLYVVAKVDTLTSFTFSFAGTELADTLGFYLCSVKEQDGFWYYGDTVYETRFRMPKEQGLATIGIPSTRLCPGTYFAASILECENVSVSAEETGIFWTFRTQ